jgi:hydroxycarboxylate dehydrogenase B
MPIFDKNYLMNVCRMIFKEIGASEQEQNILANELVGANLMGVDSHGIRQIPRYVQEVADKIVFPNAEIQVVKETANTAVVDCGFNFGHVSAAVMVDLAIKKAKKSDISFIVSQRSHHVGRLGTHVQKIAESGLVGLAWATGSRKYKDIKHGVAPWGGKASAFSTNPLAFSAPTSGNPVIVDMATSMTPKGKLKYYVVNDLDFKPGYLQDEEGNPTIDPNVVFPPREGTLLPFGYDLGHKGYCLAFMVEILASVLGGLNPDTPKAGSKIYSNEMSIIAINPKATSSNAVYYGMIDELCEDLRNIPTAPGFSEVLIPGDPEFRSLEERTENGIPIDEGTWESIIKTTEKLSLDLSAITDT